MKTRRVRTFCQSEQFEFSLVDVRAVTGSKHSNSCMRGFFSFIFSLCLLLELILVWIRLGLGSGLVLVVFPGSRLSLLHENDNSLLLEMASTVANGINC